MDVWHSVNWKNIIDNSVRGGLCFRFDKNVNLEVKESCVRFGKYLRANFAFPLRVVIYVKDSMRIKARDGEMVFGTFFRPNKFGIETYIKIAVGDYNVWRADEGRDNALASVLCGIAHELTHYFQYVNGANLTLKDEEIQATKLSYKRIREYSDFVDHP